MLLHGQRIQHALIPYPFKFPSIVTALKRWQELFESGVRSKKHPAGHAATNFNITRVQALPQTLFSKSVEASSSSSSKSEKEKKNLPLLPQKPLDLLTRDEWKQWIDYARSKSDEFANLVKKGKMNELAWQSFLGIDKLPVYPAPTHPLSYLPVIETHTSDKRVYQPVTGMASLFSISLI